MRKWKQALALVLALVMALSLVALPSFAADEDSTGTGTAVTGGSTNTPGLELRKVYDPSTGLLTLEAYATGSTTTTTSTEPVDIILVLDVSGSMDDYMETYSISPGGTYYYYDNGFFGGYERAYYCSSCDGWYTKDHSQYGHGGTRLTPKTSANGSGIQFYVTKMETLKSAVNTFIDSVATKSPDSSIAIVKFAGDKLDTVGNDTYRKGIYTYNNSQIVQELTPVNTGASSLKTTVNGLIAAGATAADYGMQHAKTIIDGAKDDGRQKVVVMFTDGEPTHSSGGDFNTVANAAISNSKSIKDAKATVYTIGCFGTLTGDTKTKVDTYMDYVSSNYPNATSMTSGGDKADPANYYKTVSSAADLNNIFTDISHTIGGATLKLGAETVLKDVVSDYFDLPANASSQITAQSYSCTALDADGAPIWNETPDQGTDYNVKINDRTISVTGFDYSANWVGKDTTTGVMHTPGKKLVVTIPIQDNGTGMGEVPTNGTDSAVYDKDGKRVCPFAQPTAYFPYFTVTHIQSNVNDNGVNYGTDGDSTKHRVPKNGEKFDLTSVVTENYLYGGSFTGENCDTVQPYGNGENPMAFTPVDQATYYIWEVPDYYLRPANYYVWRHLPENNGQKTVVRLYPLTSVDRMLYKEVGFQINGTDYVSGNNQEFDDPVGSVGTAQLYQMVKAVQNGQPYMTMYVNKGKINATAVGTDVSEDKTVNGTPIDEGFIGGLRLPQALFDQFAAGTPVTYRPYWITLDGVKVLGVRDRTSTFAAGSTQPKDSSNKYAAEYSYVSAASTQAMSFAEYFTMDDSQPVVDESLTVTVVDGSNTTQVKVAPNGSVRDQVAYQAPAGKVFAGWFADQAYTTPADLDQITQDTTIYAKYVSDSYLDLAYSRIGLFRLRGVTLISAVDNPANYQSSGIMVNGDKLNVSYASRYLIFKTPASLFGAARNAKLMLADKSLGGTGTLEVTPYWVTLDGTQVLGQTHTLHYNTRTIWE